MLGTILQHKRRRRDTSNTDWTPATALESNSPSLWMDAAPAYLNGGAPINDGDAVSAWISREGNSRDFTQATGSKQPLYRASAINGQPGVDFLTDDILVNASAFLTGQQGTAIFIYMLDAKSGAIKTMMASCDEAGSNRYITFEGASANASGTPQFQQANADTGDIVKGNTNVVVSTPLSAMFRCNGTVLDMRVNGTVQTLSTPSGGNNGDWFDDVTGADNVTIGGFKLNTEGNFFNGKIAEILIYPIALSDASLAQIAYYTAKKYGVTV